MSLAIELKPARNKNLLIQILQNLIIQMDMSYNSENMHLWPHVSKAKMRMGGVSLFWFFSCLFTIDSCLFTIFENKLEYTKHILALPFDVANFDLGHPLKMS